MSEYWKSTPRYWCKYCSTYVRDTKLERQNHEATAKHQGGVKRALRDLHRNHEQQEREKERAKREVDRLNGVVFSGSRQDASSTRDSTGASSAGQGTQAAQRQRQLEQLADLGVSIPDELRGGMAMAGDWTVTSTRVIREEDENGEAKPDALATGIRKRERTEEEQEEENAVTGLFKKPRRWGRGPRGSAEDDADLDALLGGSLVKKEPKSAEDKNAGTETQGERDDPPRLKASSSPDVKVEDTVVPVKTEPSDKGTVPDTTLTTGGSDDVANSGNQTQSGGVVFKKRKPKNIRQK